MFLRLRRVWCQRRYGISAIPRRLDGLRAVGNNNGDIEKQTKREDNEMKKPKQWMHSEGKTILWSLKQTCTIKKLPLFLWLALFLAISLSPTLSLLFSQRMIDNITAAIRDPSVKLQIGNIIIWGLFLTLSAGLSNLCALVFSTYLSNT